MRILVAEDERITRATLSRQLQAWGHEVTAAEDGEQAWGMFQQGSFDIVLSDWEMPKVSGVELVERIRAAARPEYVYVILLTGRSDKADIVRGIEAGADDYVPKPFDKDELRVRLLAGERVVRLERTLHEKNAALHAASERMRHDLKAAARVQRAMLPKFAVQTPHVQTAWKYVPTDELAGDAVGMEIIDDRYLVTYVIDVSGHGVPAALLSVTAMHALAASSDGMGQLRARVRETVKGDSPVSSPIVIDLNRRFANTDNDGRFLTMVLCVLDTHAGQLWFTRAAHPLPIVVRHGSVVPVTDDGGMPIGIMDPGEYVEVRMQLEPGDRVVLVSDGIIEQGRSATGEEYGVPRLEKLVTASTAATGAALVETIVHELAAWAGTGSFTDDVSLVCFDWLG